MMPPRPRRSFTQVAADAAAAERSAIVGYARAQSGQVTGLIERGRVTAHEGGMLQRRLNAFADAVEQGLHL
jgi:hypothetical protein